jgi:hypothetical protein
VVGSIGTPPTTATLWKNGIAQTLIGESASASSVFVSGSDVYVAGWERNTGHTLWKNGTAQAVNFTINSIFVSGSDVYLVGDDYSLGLSNPRAVLWKNGTAHNILDDWSSTRHAKISVFVVPRN